MDVSAVSWFATAVVALSAIVLASAARRWRSADSDAPSHPTFIPFVVIQTPRWNDLSKAVNRHENDISTCLNGLSRSLETAIASEASLGLPPLLSKRLESKISLLAGICEKDVKIWREWFQPFPVVKVLSNEVHQQEKNHFNEQENAKEHPPLRRKPRDPTQESSSYETVSQVVAHMVRDWTPLGVKIRHSLYGWCRQRVQGVSRWILVPGAAMGRLAWDLADEDGHHVEANDSSLLMAAGTYRLWHGSDLDTTTIHPFSLDFFTNEVDSAYRYQKVPIWHPRPNRIKGTLSYTVGDFVETYSNPSKARYNAVITCFFLDTASNIYEYLTIIRDNLVKGGRWIHVGPLQWHRNAQLHPAANELREIVQSMFQVVHWSQDNEAMDYRLDKEFRRSTKLEGFQPLRIVASKH